MEKSIFEEMTEENNIGQVEETTTLESKKIDFDLSILKTKTGEGSIETYIEHPLNFNKSKGMAQMIRGLTGLFGALDLALIDIFVGLMQISKDKKVGANID